MTTRRIILFKVNNEVVVEEPKNLSLGEIEHTKFEIAISCNCTYHDVDVEFIEMPPDISDIDLTTEGMFNWLDTTGRIISGVRLPFKLGSDAHLDAIVNNSLEQYLEFC